MSMVRFLPYVFLLKTFQLLTCFFVPCRPNCTLKTVRHFKLYKAEAFTFKKRMCSSSRRRRGKLIFNQGKQPCQTYSHPPFLPCASPPRITSQ